MQWKATKAHNDADFIFKSRDTMAVTAGWLYGREAVRGKFIATPLELFTAMRFCVSGSLNVIREVNPH